MKTSNHVLIHLLYSFSLGSLVFAVITFIAQFFMFIDNVYIMVYLMRVIGPFAVIITFVMSLIYLTKNKKQVKLFLIFLMLLIVLGWYITTIIIALLQNQVGG